MIAEKLLNLKNEALVLIAEAKDQETLEEIRLHLFGRKGEINQCLKELIKLPLEQRNQNGRLINDIKKALETALKQAQERLNVKLALKQDWLDVTAPGKKPVQGHLHLVTQAIREIAAIFEKIGFVRVRYPEVEWDWYAFESLNMPLHHPARDEFETFYLEMLEHRKLGQVVLSPHTSSGQVREMQRTKPPIRMINIEKCYRPNYDLSHTPMFHQFEGLVIDQNIAIPHLKGTLDYFAKSFFGPERKTRIRPYHFQFTEPSFEVDIDCGLCQGKGCQFCKQGWLELGGSGMVHPHVLKAGGIDSNKYRGFAFGWGVERVLLMQSGLKINDLRILYQNDLRFLNQF